MMNGDRSVTRLGVISSHPIQYLVPLWRALAAEPSIDLTVFYGSNQGAEPYYDPDFDREIAWDVPLVDGYRYRVLENKPRPNWGWRFEYRCPEIKQIIDDGEIDALLLVGKEFWYYLQAIRAGLKRQIPILYRAETPPPKRTRFEEAIADWQRRRLFSRFSACLCLGREQPEFYQRYGVGESRLQWAPYCVDNAFFQKQAEHYLPRRDEIRRQFGLPHGARVAVSVGKFMHRKRPMDLLQAYRRYADGDNHGLIMVGDGPLLETCRTFVERQDLPNVVFTGFLNQSEVGAAYAAADCFVLPSEVETWGLVVNEAMNFELPVITSDGVGCRHDLVEEGANGLTYAVGDQDGLADAITETFADESRCRAWGRRSREVIEAYSIEANVSGIVDALERVKATEVEA